MSVKVDTSLNRPDKIEPTRVNLTMKQGVVYTKEVEEPLGSLEKPMSFDDCARKFRDCAKNLGDKKNDGVIELIKDLEKVADIKKLISLLSLE
jgi:2-methylcitrate dehydratase PrpD